MDFLVQEYLLKKEYKNIVVYFTGENIRNNSGNWEVNQIIDNSNKRRGRELYTLKDKAMARDADYGLMIWDGKSKGTLGNINEMKKENKRFYVILNEEIIDDKNIDSRINHKTHKKVSQRVLFESLS